METAATEGFRGKTLAFRRLAPDDLPALFSWLSRPHVDKWYASAPRSYTEVVARYGPRARDESPVKPYVISVDGHDVGYIQAYPIDTFPEYAAQLGCEAGATGVDLFIGEETYLGWGLGARAIRAFVDEVVFGERGAPVCLAGPAEGNRASIRAFEKAGFRAWKTALNERGEKESVMRLERAP